VKESEESATADAAGEGYFFLGGFQLVSTARQVEVRVIRQGSKEKELLMTCRGIPVRDASKTENSDCYKVFSVVPGGPRPVSQLHLKLMPDNNTTNETAATTKLVSIQLTGRLPDFQQHEETPKSTKALQQMTPSSAMMMQQMMMMANGGGATHSTGLFQASTPMASGSTPRHPFSSPNSVDGDRRPQAASLTPQMMGTSPPLTTPASTNISRSQLAGTSWQPTPRSQQTTSYATPNSNNHQAAPNNSMSTNTSEAIIAGMSFLVRSEGQATLQQVQSSLQQHERATQERISSLESTVLSQQRTIHTLVEQQQIIMQRQMETMALVMQQQQLLLGLHSSGHFPPPAPQDAGINSGFPMESSYDPTCRVPDSANKGTREENEEENNSKQNDETEFDGETEFDDEPRSKSDDDSKGGGSSDHGNQSDQEQFENSDITDGHTDQGKDSNSDEDRQDEGRDAESGVETGNNGVGEQDAEKPEDGLIDAPSLDPHHSVVWELDAPNNPASSIEQTPSMVDYLSIKCSNTGVMAAASLPSMLDQSESIEVLAVFQKTASSIDNPDSPQGISPSSTASSHSRSNLSSDLNYPHGQVGWHEKLPPNEIMPARTDYTAESSQTEREVCRNKDNINGVYIESSYDESYDGDEDEDLISVTLNETENVQPNAQRATRLGKNFLQIGKA